MMSPILVPVAWALTKSTRSADRAASLRAMRRVSVIPARFGSIRSPPLLLQAKPITSPRIVAPRRLACSYSSKRTAPAPSPTTSPSRWTSKGRGAGEQIVEDGHGGRIVFIGPAAQHRVLHAVLHRLVAVTDGLAARRAGRAGGDHPAGDAEHPGDVHRRRVDHGLEIIDGADGGELRPRPAEEGLVDLALDRRAAVGGTEGAAGAAGCHESRCEARRFEDLFGHLTGVIGHRPHGLSVGPLEIIPDRIIDGPEDLGVNELRQEVILPERFHARATLPEALHDLAARMTDGGDRRTGRNDDSSFRHWPKAASIRIGPKLL